MPTYAELQTRVRYRTGNRSTLTSGDGLTILQSSINDAQRELAHTFWFHECEDSLTVTATINQYYIELGAFTNIYAILSCYDTTNSVFIDPFRGGIERFERTFSTVSGTPSQWLHHSDQLLLTPTPSAAISYRLNIYTEIPDMTTGNSPVIPLTFHKAIEHLAVRNVWNALGDEERAMAADKDYNNYLRRVRPPKAFEAYTSKRRGVVPLTSFRNRRLGV
jgi:hypothetical protein